MKALVIDNYDSFTYNLVQYLGELGAVVQVMRNDAVSLETVAAAGADHIVISPGPGRPEHAGVTMDVIRRLGETTTRSGSRSSTPSSSFRMTSSSAPSSPRY